MSKTEINALVTGASRGIGLAIASMLLKRGCRVLGSYAQDKEGVQCARKALGALSRKIAWVQADLSVQKGVQTLVQAVTKRYNHLDYLISNVGITDKTSFGQVTPEMWERVLHTNLTAPFFLVQGLADLLPRDRGRIIFIGTVMGIYPHPISFSYGASKAGLHFLAQTLVKTMSPRGVTINVVAPGFVETAMQTSKDSAHRKRIEQKISLRRFAKPEEIADVVESLLDLGYVTGQILRADGGYDFE